TPPSRANQSRYASAAPPCSSSQSNASSRRNSPAASCHTEPAGRGVLLVLTSRSNGGVARNLRAMSVSDSLSLDLSFRARGRGQQVGAWACSAHRRGGESLPSGAVPGAETKEISAYGGEHVISALPIAQRRAVPPPSLMAQTSDSYGQWLSCRLGSSPRPPLYR